MSEPYKVWESRKSLGVIRDVKLTPNYWGALAFVNEITANDPDGWIDFEKLPAVVRKLAPFVRPLAQGKPIYEDNSKGFRFKPAYVKVLEAIDPLAPLVKRPGIDRSILDETKLTPMQRLDLLRAAMTAYSVQAIERRVEWMRAKAIIDAKYIVVGEDYPAVEIDFRRDPRLTITKTPGTFWGDSGVSIFDDIQRYCDLMFDIEFGGFPKRITFGSRAWAVARRDEEFMKHMDVNIREPRATVERGILASDKAVKVGELTVGGTSGATIELWLYRDTYINDAKQEVPFMEPTDIVITSSAESIQGYDCYGAIIDRKAGYQPLKIFARSWLTTGDPEVEYMLHQSAPLAVPLNPNATARARVVAAN